jgi:sec-independent protein translocase protein TatA
MGSGLFSPTHLVILLAVALLLFGAKRLPEIGRSLGVGMREFKDSVTGVQEATRLDTPSELPPPAATTVAPAAEAAPEPAPAVAEPVVAAPVVAEPVVAEPERETEQIS